VGSSETQVSYNTTGSHNPEERDMNLHRHENLKSRIACQSAFISIAVVFTCLVDDAECTANEVAGPRRLHVGVLQLVHDRAIHGETRICAELGALAEVAPVIGRYLKQVQRSGDGVRPRCEIVLEHQLHYGINN